MKEVFCYWWRCAKAAAKGNSSFANSWQWIFGIPVVSGIVGYIAVRTGRTEVSTGFPILDGFLVALGAFVVTWVVAFCGRLLTEPVRVDRGRLSEIEKLKKLAGEARSSSFDVFVEQIADADRMSIYSEQLFRIGITNLETDRALETYAVVEKILPPLPVSPAARLPFMGRGTDILESRIAPSETAYVLLLERQRDDHRGRFAPYVTFSVDSSHRDLFSRTMALLDRDAGRGQLEEGTVYTAVVAVHAADAISNRITVSVRVEAGGIVSVAYDPAVPCGE
jgi:hypothetical protein